MGDSKKGAGWCRWGNNGQEKPDSALRAPSHFQTESYSFPASVSSSTNLLKGLGWSGVGGKESGSYCSVGTVSIWHEEKVQEMNSSDS